MSQPISLKDIERKAFRSVFDDGLWDIFIGCFFLIFVIGPFLSPYLGDFWSTVIFLPFWGAVYLIIVLVRKFVVFPRTGEMKIGPVRRVKIMRFSLIMLVLNTLSVVLGFVFAAEVFTVPGQWISVVMGIIMLTFFTALGYFLDVHRLYVYGLIVGVSPVIGEWLWSRGLTSHHGLPLIFGAVSAVMILVGAAILVRLIRANPLPPEGAMPVES